jgi:hypothetical protein
MLYKAVVRSILLFGSETWVMTNSMLKALESFHRRVARRIAGKQPYLRAGEWIYPPILDKVLEEVGLNPVEDYILKRQNTVADYIATRPIFDLCLDAERQSGSQSSRRWWEQVDRDFDDGIAVDEEF